MDKANEKAVKMARSYMFFSGTKDLWPRLASLPYALIKGEALSIMAYNGVGKRLYGDIDILVDRENIHQLETICQESGFISRPQSREERILYLSASHQTYPYTKQMGKFCIDMDLNFDIFWGEYQGKRVNLNEFLSDTVEMDIHENMIKTLSPLKAMVQLILHHYKEMNSLFYLCGGNSINRQKFDDIYFLWKNNSETISLDNLYTISSAYGIIPYVFYVLYFTNLIFQDMLLKRYVEAFQTPEGRMLLDCYGLTNQERKTWKVDFYTRLNAKNLYLLIQDDLTPEDHIKLKRNIQLFGRTDK